MHIFFSTVVILFLCWMFFTQTWIGRSCIILLKSFKELCKSMYLCTLWTKNKITKINKKMKRKVSKKPNVSGNNVIDFKTRTKVR